MYPCMRFLAATVGKNLVIGSLSHRAASQSLKVPLDISRRAAKRLSSVSRLVQTSASITVCLSTKFLK